MLGHITVSMSIGIFLSRTWTLFKGQMPGLKLLEF